MAKIRPIVLRDGEVKAILDGAKTEIRRPIKRLLKFGKITEFAKSDTPGDDWCFREKTGLWHEVTTERLLELSPYGRPGDRLWVRETWRMSSELNNYVNGYKKLWVEYRVGWRRGFKQQIDTFPIDSDAAMRAWGRYKFGAWRSPMHMPRWASRITLEITDIQIEQGIWVIYFKVVK